MIHVESKLESRTVKSFISVSKNLKKYFSSFNFFSSYDEEIDADSSILNIPVLSIVLPLAWIIGSDVYVDKLDKTFAESMQPLQDTYKKIYPKAPFATKLIVKTLVENKNSPDKTALLFSGGLDATYSLVSNISLNPRLILVLGTDVPNSNAPYLELVKKEYSNFAEREGLIINFIRTNALEILNRRRVDYLFWKFQELLEGDFWKGVGYAFGHLGQTVPLSSGRFNRLLIGAWADKENACDFRKHPDSSSPLVDEKIAWSNIRVKHDGCFHRYEKVDAMKEYLAKRRITLRVCWEQPEKSHPNPPMNCGQCEKCLRTMAAFALMGINPKEYGLPLDDSTVKRMKDLFVKKRMTQSHISLWWKPFQQIIPDKIEGTFFGLEPFFKWFKTINLDLAARPFNRPFSLQWLYYKFPFTFSILVRNILSFPFKKYRR